MIKNNEPISMAEAKKYIDKDRGAETLAFIKKFSKMNEKIAREMREKLNELDLIKLDGKMISKIIDVMPTNQEELNKVFVGLSLDEEESKKVLEIVKEFKK